MKQIKIILPINPTGKQRPRFTITGKFRKAYKSDTQKLEENKIVALLYEHKPPQPLDCPIEIAIDAFMPIPVSWPKWKKLAAINGEIRPVKKPDIDNLAKQMLDCMNQIFWKDDRQIVGLLIRKYYSENPRWVIKINQI